MGPRFGNRPRIFWALLAWLAAFGVGALVAKLSHNELAAFAAAIAAFFLALRLLKMSLTEWWWAGIGSEPPRRPREDQKGPPDTAPGGRSDRN